MICSPEQLATDCHFVARRHSGSGSVCYDIVGKVTLGKNRHPGWNVERSCVVDSGVFCGSSAHVTPTASPMSSGNKSQCQALLYYYRKIISIQGYLRHPTASALPRIPSVRDSSQLSGHGAVPTEAVWKRLCYPPPVYTPEQVSPLRNWEGLYR